MCQASKSTLVHQSKHQKVYSIQKTNFHREISSDKQFNSEKYEDPIKNSKYSHQRHDNYNYNKKSSCLDQFNVRSRSRSKNKSPKTISSSLLNRISGCSSNVTTETNNSYKINREKHIDSIKAVNTEKKPYTKVRHSTYSRSRSKSPHLKNNDKTVFKTTKKFSPQNQIGTSLSKPSITTESIVLNSQQKEFIKSGDIAVEKKEKKKKHKHHHKRDKNEKIEKSKKNENKEKPENSLPSNIELSSKECKTLNIVTVPSKESPNLTSKSIKTPKEKEINKIKLTRTSGDKKISSSNIKENSTNQSSLKDQDLINIKSKYTDEQERSAKRMKKHDKMHEPATIITTSTLEKVLYKETDHQKSETSYLKKEEQKSKEKTKEKKKHKSKKKKHKHQHRSSSKTPSSIKSKT